MIYKLIVAMLVVLSVGACGGGEKSSSPKSSVTVTSTVTVTATSKAALQAAAPAAGVVAESVRSGGTGAAWTSSATAVAGEAIQFQTKLRARAPANVRLVFERGPQTRLRVTATVNGHSSHATVGSTSGAHLSLLQLHYTCAAPPDPSFCPIHGVKTTAATFTMAFRASTGSPVVIGATVGPANLPRLVPAAAAGNRLHVIAAGRLVVPAKGAAKPVSSPFGSSVTAKPGDLVVLVVHILGRRKSAPGRLKVTIHQGPGASLTALASLPGQQSSAVDIKSSTGSPITLVLPRYTCFVPPDPTDCTAVAASASHGIYTAVFPASSSLPPISLLAGVDGPKGLALH